MNITGDKVIVNKSDKEVFELASIPSGYEQLMPSNVVKFEADEEGFVFALGGMPEIGLKIKELIPNSKIILTSAKDSLDFELNLFIEKITETTSEIQFVFDGKFNMLVSAMAEKPLKNFISSLTENMSNLS